MTTPREALKMLPSFIGKLGMNLHDIIENSSYTLTCYICIQEDTQAVHRLIHILICDGNGVMLSEEEQDDEKTHMNELAQMEIIESMTSPKHEVADLWSKAFAIQKIINPDEQILEIRKLQNLLTIAFRAIQMYFKLNNTETQNKRRKFASGNGVTVLPMFPAFGNVLSPETTMSVYSTTGIFLSESDKCLVDRCYAFIKSTGILRSDGKFSPEFTYTALEVSLVVAQTRSRLSLCLKKSDSKNEEYISRGLPGLFPESMPTSTAQVTDFQWSKLESEIRSFYPHFGT